jgi:hypothetical protein
MIEYLLKRESDAEFEFNWANSFFPGYGDTKGAPLDFILAIQKSNPNLFQLTEVCNTVFVIIFKHNCGSMILKYNGHCLSLLWLMISFS